MKKLHICLIIAGIWLFQNPTIGQSTMDVFFPEKGSNSLAIGYTTKSYDKFYRGKNLTDGNPANFGSISSNIVSIYGSYSFSNRFTGILNLPYIIAKNENGVLDPVQMKSKISALQDLSLGLKGKIWSKAFDNSSLTIGSGGVVHFPVSNYGENGILSVGNGAFAIEGMVMIQYQIYGGLFSEIQSGYSFRQNKDFNIPNALIGEFKVGYAHAKFYLAASVGLQNSESSFDIGSDIFVRKGSAAILPDTEVDYTVLNINGYIPLGKSKLGITIGYGKVLNGRNVGAESYLTWGLVSNNLSFRKSSTPTR